LVGSVLVAVKLPEGRPFAVARTMMLVIAVRIPRRPTESAEPPSAAGTPAPEALGGQVSG
jgi:hypothetical protein